MTNSSVFIIAEAGVNHNGSIKYAFELIDAAVEAGADAVKFQSFRADASVRKTAQKANYQKGLTDEEETHYEMSKRLELSGSDHQQIAEYCLKQNIMFLSSPFDLESARMLRERFKMNAFKIPSGELTNAPLLYEISMNHAPVILSTGMSSLQDIEEALGVLAYGYLGGESPSKEAFRKAFSSLEGQKWLKQKVALLHCVSEYPTSPKDVHLKVMDLLRGEFGLRVGFSDHTLGIAIPIAAAARGASIIEKHFTLDKQMEGPDHKASLSPVELREMVEGIRTVEAAIGYPDKTISDEEKSNRTVVRKSVVATRDIRAGEPFTSDNIGCMRPGTGVSPYRYWDFIGKRASRAYLAEEELDDQAGDAK
ncbi:N-acetylneuraminate synthase [Halobacillus salinus]|uniref:N-acetylneuraminate synthase n=1 Tax=Halobacillus salinus TaxID=192814 RepID=UPI0009A84ADF|nr:N-acetylneuraminate synthase [Halobacillus salinus]